MGVMDREWYRTPRPWPRRLLWWAWGHRRELLVVAVLIAVYVLLPVRL